MKYRYSEQMKNITAEEMRTFFRIGHEKAAVNLFSGDPPADCLPVADLAAAAERCFAKPDPDAFSYATGYGYAPLRVRLAGYARTVLKIGAESDSILITEGAVQAIDAIVSVFCNPDDAVVVDQLTSPFVLMLLKQKGIEVIPVEMDNEGMVPERLAAILAGNPRIKLVYLTPDFQVPTGVTVPESRRRRLLEVVKKYDVALYAPSRLSRYATIETENLHNVSTHLCATYFTDYSREDVKHFILAYRALFNAEPGQFAMHGYDVVNYFGSICSVYGRQWAKRLPDYPAGGIQTAFHFGKYKGKGNVNDAIIRVLYTPDFKLQAVR